MICPYCGNETGSKVICSYCGHRVYDDARNPGYPPGMGDNATLPVNTSGSGLGQDPEIRKRLRNIDTWGLMGLVLLGGIFLLELIRFVLSFI